MNSWQEDCLLGRLNSRDELMSDIRSTNLTENAEGKAEIMVVNIQKFKQDFHQNTD